MSTVEEAREQARKALATISKRMAGSRLGKSTMREMDADILALRQAQDALRALLDATEPHERQAIHGGEEHVCATCPKNSYGYHVAWDQAHPEVPVIRHDEDCEADGGSEGQESPCRCAMPTDRPAEDEREALVNVIRLFFQNWRAIGRVSPSLEVSIDSLEGAVDDLIELTGPRPITDEMVEAAAGADFEFGKESMTWDAWAAHDSDHAGWPRKKARAALEAAEGARR